ncbi:MAG TPA: RHS repeat-associated core domain-containing protein [Chloroflexota bacterium]|nr:RHS repeat-associated core domain-containing protein [Chloroflexota bacterium]
MSTDSTQLQVTTYAYDTINRLTGVTYPTGTANVTYGYDNADRRTSMADGTGTTTYAYDEVDRLSSVTFSGSRAVAYQYDAAGNRTRITYPDTKAVNYAYDDANRLSTVTDWVSNTTAYAYDDAGRLTTTTFPTGVVEARTYTTADQLLSHSAAKAGNTLTSFTYALDDAGMRTAVQTAAGTESYTHDALYRLTGVTYADGTLQGYTYDPAGNRLTKTQGGTTTTYAYDNADRLTTVGGVSYTFDANGNQTGRGADTFTWDAENRLTSAVVAGATSTSVYRGDGLRHSLTTGGATATYTWDVAAGLPVVLQDGSSTYVYGFGGALISQTAIGGAQTHVLSDGLGSTAAMTDSSGAITAAYQYDVFGALRASSGTGSSEYRYTGQQQEAASGLTYLRARFYDSVTGRFLSKDPFPGATALPASQHPYAYAHGAPTQYTDPSGLCLWDLCLGEAELTILGIGFLAATAGPSIHAWIESGTPQQIAAAFDQMVDCAGQTIGDFIQQAKRRAEDFTRGQKGKLRDDNMERNEGAYLCEICGRDMEPAEQSKSGVRPPDNEAHADHKIPVAQGGKGELENGQMICRYCNLRKGSTLWP